MRASLVQMNPISGDIKGNMEKIIREIELSNGKSDVIIFPEMSLTGYCISDLIEDKKFLEYNKKALDEIASHVKNIVAIVGFIDYKDNGERKKYNAAAVIQNGKIVEVIHKSLLPNYRYFDDKRYFSESKERNIVYVKIGGKDVRLGVTICEDMWDEDYDVKPVSELIQKGAELIININASPFYPGKLKKRDEIIRNHIKNSDVSFIYVNTVGIADNGKNIIPFDGQSLVYNKGKLVFIGDQFKEQTYFVEIEDSDAISLPKERKEKEIYECLVMSIKDYARKTGFTKVIEPISGGIDSALGFAICVEAFGKENVIAYNLPSVFNTSTTKGIASRLADNFGVKYNIVPIQDIYDKILGSFNINSHGISDNVAKENVYARVRGLLMMLESNDSKAMLISNGNKTEIALGYSTLYGDMCGGISLIGDLSKTDVYAVSRYVNEKYGKEMIPEEAFTIKPSAELSEGQFDPFDYSIVSPLVDLFIERRLDPSEIIKLFELRNLDFGKDSDGKTVYEKYDSEGFRRLVYDMYRKFRNSVFKRIQGAPIIAVTERAFGFDLRETLINRWDGNE